VVIGNFLTPALRAAPLHPGEGTSRITEYGIASIRFMRDESFPMHKVSPLSRVERGQGVRR